MNQAQQHKAAGTLDPTFGIDGVVDLPFKDIPGSIPYGVLTLAQQKLLVLLEGSPENSPAKVARLDEGGALDESFGTGGVVDIHLGEKGRFSPTGLHRVADGWLATGYVRGSGVNDLAVVRQKDDGEFDPDFGPDKDGIVVINLKDLIGTEAGKSVSFLKPDQDGKNHEGRAAGSGGGIGATSVVKQDGKIYLASPVDLGGGFTEGIVLRLNSNGKVDTSFNEKGYVLIELPDVGHHEMFVQSVAVQQDGKVLVCGSFTRYPRTIGAFVIRYLENGRVDSGYGNSGVVALQDSERWFDLGSVTLKPDGGVVATGKTGMDGVGEGLIISLNSSGAFNLVFNGGKPLYSGFMGDGLSWGNCLLQEDGKLIVTGAGDGAVKKLVTARYSGTGILDSTFGGGGWVTYDHPGGNDFYWSSALMSGNRVVVGALLIGSNRNQGYLLRYLG